MLLLISGLLFTSLCQGQWHAVNSSTTARINDLVFISDATGYAVTGDGAVLKSTDTGENWTALFNDTSLYFAQSLAATDDSIFCFGQTVEGGPIKISFAEGTETIYHKEAVSFSPARPLYYNGKIWFLNYADGKLTTYYNGATDIRHTGYDVDGFTISNDKIVQSNGTQFIYSEDYGESWNTLSFTDNPLSSHAYQSYYNGGDTFLAITNYPTSIYYSYNKGADWSRHYPPINGLYYYFISAVRLLGYSSRYIYASDDMGYTFDTVALSDNIKGICFYRNNPGFAYGENGMIYRYLPDGATSIKRNPATRAVIEVYPNPSHNRINIGHSPDLSVIGITLTDISGKLLRFYSREQAYIDLTGYAKGIYFLHINTGKGSVTKKLAME